MKLDIKNTDELIEFINRTDVYPSDALEVAYACFGLTLEPMYIGRNKDYTPPRSERKEWHKGSFQKKDIIDWVHNKTNDPDYEKCGIWLSYT